MTVSSVSAPALAPSASGPRDKARTPEEAAEQFEAVLVRQFVDAMTESLFDGEAAGAMRAQVDAQRDAMASALTDELVESGALRFRDLLMRQWGASEAPAAAPAPAPDLPPEPDASGDAHFELLRAAAPKSA